MASTESLKGKRFGMLLVMSRTENRNGKPAWNCLCDCGKQKVVSSASLLKGTKSCGCIVGKNCKDLKGKRFGKLTVIQKAGSDNRGPLWECLCDCGNTKIVVSRSLLSGSSNSCGCLSGKRAENLIGKKFGLLTVMAREANLITPSRVIARWRCICECGKTTVVRGHNLRSKTTRSCGCLARRSRAEDLTGLKFGKLTVQKKALVESKRVYWECLCDCGEKHFVHSAYLKNGTVSSCGCLRVECKTKHSMTGTKIYYVWAAMKQRCSNPNNKDYPSYGGRGIKLCKRWFDFKNFLKIWGNHLLVTL